jgi:hypothetical protein
MNPNIGATVERLSPDDFTELACDVGPAPMQIAAVLILDGGSALEPAAVVDAIADRIRSVPRLPETRAVAAATVRRRDEHPPAGRRRPTVDAAAAARRGHRAPTSGHRRGACLLPGPADRTPPCPPPPGGKPMPTQLGNRVGVIPVQVPTGGDPPQRLQAIAGITRTR